MTYAVRNKKIQTIRIDESDSDDDPDIANQSLSQSQMLARSMLTSGDYRAEGLQSFNEPGFANMAFRTLIQNDLRNRSSMSMATDGGSSTDLERSHRSVIGGGRGAAVANRPMEGDIAEESSRSKETQFVDSNDF